MKFIREEIYSPDGTYFDKLVNTDFYLQRKAQFNELFEKLENSLGEDFFKELKSLKIIVYQLLNEVSAENFARGFRCAMRLMVDSFNHDNDGEIDYLPET